MGDRIILTKLDERADGILDRFQAQTGLDHVDDEHDKRTFHLAGPEHGIDVVETLTAIDEHWPSHVGFEDPS